MIGYTSKYRSAQDELMDDFEFGGDELNVLLNDLSWVNKWLGGNSITLSGIKSLIKTHSGKEPLRIVDFGCGDGEVLRLCAKVLEKRGVSYELIGLDANNNILKEAERRSLEYTNLKYLSINVLSDEMDGLEYDLALCTLFLHHFSNEDIIKLLNKISEKAQVGVVINDLERSRTAFWLFKFLSRFLLKSKTAKSDGLVSITRAFKKRELLQLSTQIAGSHIIKWRWAFRYQWIIKKI